MEVVSGWLLALEDVVAFNGAPEPYAHGYVDLKDADGGGPSLTKWASPVELLPFSGLPIGYRAAMPRRRPFRASALLLP